MRAWEIIGEGKSRRPEISLRHLNDLKHIGKARAASLARRDRLVRIMYANPAREHERIELEKARLELEQQKAEIAATKAEVQAKTLEAIGDMAKSAAEIDNQTQAKIATMARSQMRRRKK